MIVRGWAQGDPRRMEAKLVGITVNRLGCGVFTRYL